MNSNKLEKIPNCIIDKNGVFKYIQILVTDMDISASKVVVRGFKKCAYHDDNLQEFRSKEYFNIEEVNHLGVDSECIGGGRVNVKENEKSILVYGFSQG